MRVAYRKQERAQQVAAAEAALADIAQFKKITRNMREAAGEAPCVACMTEVCKLEGVTCPADCEKHFMCDECFDGWVKSESVPAADHVPKDAGEVWCMCKASVAEGSVEGCTSTRPFLPQARLLQLFLNSCL